MSDPVYRLGVDIFLGDRIEVRVFECASCGDYCETTTTEAEANRELIRSGMPEGELASVCDGCYEYLMGRAAEDGLLI